MHARFGAHWHGRRMGSYLNWLLLPVPLLIPELFSRAYQPINESFTVEWLGCSCPFLDGRTRLFNANDFNAILWLIVCAATIAMWIWLFKRALWQAPSIPRAVGGGFGIAVIWLWSIKCYAAGCWL